MASTLMGNRAGPPIEADVISAQLRECDRD